MHVWDGTLVRPLDAFPREMHEFSAIYVWNEPDFLRQVPKGILKLENHQIADFNFCQPGWENVIDVFTSPSPSHMAWMAPQTPCPGKWRMVPNGWDPDMFPATQKVPGRVIYASSPDRGLHWLLQQWPRIRKEVPHATLRIFYDFDNWANRIGAVRNANPGVADFKELHFRALYITEAVKRLASHGVQHLKAVSRKQMAVEFGEAECLAYPCDPVRYTETFCVTALEGCATGAIPVMASADALGDIFGGYAPMVAAPVAQHLDEWTGMVVQALSDPAFQKEWRGKGSELARKTKWSDAALCLEPIIEEGLKKVRV
jgi:glycosyltransferase involved in cell wall biosynthesis